tara:strand:- start:371 stop:568 length:198 start_codon:yes stop_codon:yes gene_type:complete
MIFKVGQLVKWFEDYDDGISGRDYGDGIVIEIKMHQSHYSDDYPMYKVYRNKHKDFYWFEKRQLI